MEKSLGKDWEKCAHPFEYEIGRETQIRFENDNKTKVSF